MYMSNMVFREGQCLNYLICIAMELAFSKCAVSLDPDTRRMLRFPSVASHASGISHPPGSGNRTRPTILASVLSDELIRRVNDWVDGASMQESSFSLENCTSHRSQQSLPISKSPVQQSSHLGGSNTKENMNEVHEANKNTEESHPVLQKSWVCVDISPDKTALANCRACHKGRRYDSIYGALTLTLADGAKAKTAGNWR
ncbi:hypothetical protein BDV41DRAFT_375159 [Aspergillus transmontanensis]|uniref:DUF7896 domain-containing protein n=1 Tax=Aspergillus transmontanensis TaxID=1034304 RepID=A0A5N6WC04_9EURO|nr:hypothetical protein BDV41DRAFT_375159 [Aspergillus transmontanensis]